MSSHNLAISRNLKPHINVVKRVHAMTGKQTWRPTLSRYLHQTIKHTCQKLKIGVQIVLKGFRHEKLRLLLRVLVRWIKYRPTRTHVLPILSHVIIYTTHSTLVNNGWHNHSVYLGKSRNVNLTRLACIQTIPCLTRVLHPSPMCGCIVQYTLQQLSSGPTPMHFTRTLSLPGHE